MTRKPRIWTIWDFPENLYVLLSKEPHTKFFNYMFKKYGGKRPYARFLGIGQMHLKQYWRRYSRKNGNTYIQYTPLWVFKKSCDTLALKRKVENGIYAIRVRAGDPIIRPKLKILESPELYRIVAHLIGDGFAGKTHVPYYSNNCKELRYQFKKDLQIFGKIPTYERKTKTVTCLMFPKPISDIMRHIFKIEFIRPTRLPKEIFSASDKCKGTFLQALFDDEGCISSNIVIAMNNFNLVNSIKNLIKSLGIKTSKITKRKDHKDYYSLYVSEKDVASFKQNIGVIHPKKLKRLNYKLKIKERNNITRTRPLNWTRNRILSLLKRGPMTTIEISNKLLLTFPGIYHHLNYLKNSKKIIEYGYKNKKEWYLL